MISVPKNIRALCLVVSLLVLSAFAAPAGGFGGTCTLSAPVVAGECVHLPVSLAVATPASSGISNTTIALEPTAGRANHGRVSGLVLPAPANAQGNSFFTAPQGAYDFWQKKVLRS